MYPYAVNSITLFDRSLTLTDFADCRGEIALKYDTTFSGQARKRFDTPMLSVKIKNIPQDKQVAFWVGDDEYIILRVPHIVTARSPDIPGCKNLDQGINTFQVQEKGVKFDGNYFG